MLGIHLMEGITDEQANCCHVDGLYAVQYHSFF